MLKIDIECIGSNVKLFDCVLFLNENAPDNVRRVSSVAPKCKRA
jgi:hypothetical protein